jgi:hypothetical protein
MQAFDLLVDLGFEEIVGEEEGWEECACSRGSVRARPGSIESTGREVVGSVDNERSWIRTTLKPCRRNPLPVVHIVFL